MMEHAGLRRFAREMGFMLVLAGVILSLAVVFSDQVRAADNVTATKHNISANAVTYGVTNYGEICVYCHTPHNGSTTAKPLWNRNVPAGPFSMYDAAWSSTINNAVDAAPTGVSLACLSCHDGTIGLDTVLNRPGSSGWAVPTNALIKTTGAADYEPRLGTNMRNDHPISIVYDPAVDTGLKAKAAVTAAGLKLFTDGAVDKVQCASCHNPHEDTNPTFLRISNAGSAVCLTCHIK